MPLVAGSRLDSYEIVAPLGAGGMGEVYRARDSVLKRDVAIKVLPSDWSRDPERLHRFELEAQAAAALNHPNIISIFHVGQYDGSPYMVIELLQGETLRDHLRKGPMRLREVLDFGAEMVRGLAAAHDAGVVHRDLKPENIFVTKDGRIKILDFGLARLDPAKAASADGSTISLGTGTSPGQMLGTVGYMSPEQVRGQAADGRSDIFAVGVILYEMLTGRRAFQKATSAETMTAILNEDPPPVVQDAQRFPPPLQKIVSRCLEKKPEQRFQHASDLGFALETLSESSGIAISPVRQDVPGKRWIWVVAGTLAVAIAVALIAWLRQPPAIPSVEAVTQITDDGETKWIHDNLLTDGSRVYFNEGTNYSLQIAQVAATGGATAIIPTRFARPRVVGVDPEGSSLLALVSPEGENPALALWTIPLPTGEPRRLGNLEAQDATFSRDGKILFSQANDLYTADSDGSNPRKLLTADGAITGPDISPDLRHLLFTVLSPSAGNHRPIASIVVSNADGSNRRAIVDFKEGRQVCCAQWTPDGRYIVFLDQNDGRPDIWIAQWRAGFFQHASPPAPLTNGPLSYTGPMPSRDGTQIFAIGTKQRGELVRYDTDAKEFVPILSGISAFSPTYSSDGKWVAYTSYPDHTLWRSRSDGTERLQLTYSPAKIAYPFISPDGKRVSYQNVGDQGIYVIDMDGGQPQRVPGKAVWGATWSPDGNVLVLGGWVDPLHTQFHFFDLRTRQSSVVPGPNDLLAVEWVADHTLVGVSHDRATILAFDVNTQKWSDLVPGPIPGGVINWTHSPDFKYVYYTTGGAEPQAWRVRLADHKVELITSLKDLTRATGISFNTRIGVAPDGSAVFTRDIGSEEIYALKMKWP